MAGAAVLRRLRGAGAELWFAGLAATLAAALLFAVLGHHAAALRAPPPEPADAMASTVAPLPESGPAAGAQLARLALFGREPGPVAAPAAATPADLNLVLTGIVPSGQGRAGRVILAGPDGRERSYAVGERLPGDVTLLGIERDRILLEQGTRVLELALPVVGNPASPPPLGIAGQPQAPKGAVAPLIPRS